MINNNIIVQSKVIDGRAFKVIYRFNDHQYTSQLNNLQKS